MRDKELEWLVLVPGKERGDLRTNQCVGFLVEVVQELRSILRAEVHPCARGKGP